MRNGPKRWLPVAALLAILPAALLPALRGQLPDYLLGAIVGVALGLAIVALVCAKRDARGAAARHRER